MKLKVTIDGKTYEVDVEVAPEPAPVLPTFTMQSPASIIATAPASPPGGGNGDGVVNEEKVCRSPVSGIVVKSNVRAGQSILPGDILFILEAMKMETEITAPHAGKVAKVKVNTGESVKSGEVVLEWE
jgi:methylmalonyl-CoA carboxyltransferase small subunit